MRPDTLADLVLRETCRPHTNMLYFMKSRSMENLRDTIQRSRKFVLDESMSSFLADLSQLNPGQRTPEIFDSLRHSARLPFPTVWVELNFQAFRKRHIELDQPDVKGGKLADPIECPLNVGFLLEEHPQVNTAIRCTEFFSDPVVAPMPFSWVWQTTDDPLPWNSDTDAGMFLHGIVGYFSKQYGVVYDRTAKMNQPVSFRGKREDGGNTNFMINNMVGETSGSGRYMICLLAALDDIPVLRTFKQQSHGFIARGRYRKFVDYQILKLNVPTKTSTVKLARKLIGIARRRAHQVRGHWRKHTDESLDWCDPSFHQWTAADEHGRSQCSICKAKRTWIKQHQRGDATLGFVTHDYNVGHEV